MPLGRSHRRAPVVPVLTFVAAVLPAWLAAPAQQVPDLARNGRRVAQPVSPVEFVATVQPELLARLDHADATIREQATNELASGPYSMGAIEEALARTDLSLEQRARLRTAARSIFERTPRAALGVTFTATDPARRATTLEPIEGFESFDLLKAGDVLQAINGRPIIDQADARRVILSHDPGEQLALRISRNGEPLEIKVRLGRRDNLPAESSLNTRIDPDELARAWPCRAERLGDSGAKPLVSAVTAERWRRAATMGARRSSRGADEPTVDPLTSEPIRSPLPPAEVPEVAMGGEARVSRSEAEVELGSRTIVLRPGQAEIIIQPRIREGGDREALAEFIAQLTRQRNEVAKLLEDNNLRLADPRHDAGVRQLLLGDRMRLQASIKELDRQIDQLQRMAGVVP